MSSSIPMGKVNRITNVYNFSLFVLKSIIGANCIDDIRPRIRLIEHQVKGVRVQNFQWNSEDVPKVSIGFQGYIRIPVLWRQMNRTVSIPLNGVQRVPTRFKNKVVNLPTR